MGKLLLKDSRKTKHIHLDPDEIRLKIFVTMISEFPELKSLIQLYNIREQSKNIYKQKEIEKTIHKQKYINISKPKLSERTPLWKKLHTAQIKRP
jgi:hypothetical protein